MPVTYSGLYERIISFENLYLAYEDARRGRKEKPEVLAFYAHPEERITTLHEKLRAHTWEPSPYFEFLSRQEVKRRVIHAPTFPDRIVHMALYRVLMPLFERKFIFDSYACRMGKGTWAAVERAQDFLRRAKREYGTVYVLQGDFAKCYESIYKPYLMEKLAATIRDRETLELLELIYYSYNDNLRGIPIGAATSQLAANVVLDTLDHFAKEILGAKYYLRYMDDFLILGRGKAELWDYLKEIRWLADTTLKIKLNPKTRVFPAKQGIDFCGYRTWATHILPRKRNVKAAKRRFKHLTHAFRRGEIRIEDAQPRVASFLGYMKHCAGRRTTKSTLSHLNLTRGESQHGKNSTSTGNDHRSK